MDGLQPFHPLTLLLIAAINPAVIIVGFVMGRHADQWQKLIVAAFAASIVGSALVWIAAWTGLLPARGIGGEAGLFVLQMAFGLLWAGIGFAVRKR